MTGLLLAPADLVGLGGVDALHPVDRLVGDELHPGVVEVQAGADLRVHVVTHLLGDGFHTELGHVQRVLLGGGPDDATLHRGDARVAAAVHGYDRRLDSCRVQRLGGTGGGRFVDRVDEVDVLGLGQAGLHGRLALVRGTVGGLVAEDLVVSALAAGVLAGLVLVAVLGLVLDVDAHAGQEALVAVVVDRGHLVVEQVEEGDVGFLALHRGRRPLADELAGLEVVGGEGDVHDVRRVWRGVQRDHIETGSASRLDRRVYPLGRRGDQDSLVAPGHGRLDGGDLGRLVAVFLARGRGDRDVVGLPGFLSTLLHGDEERVGARLGDQRDRDLLAATATVGGLASRSSRVTAATGGECQGRGGGERQDGQKAPASAIRR